MKDKLRQGNGSATIAPSQNGRVLAGEPPPPAPTKTSSTTATTPGALNSDLVNTDDSDTTSEQHGGSPSQSEGDEVKKRNNAKLKCRMLRRGTKPFRGTHLRIWMMLFFICAPFVFGRLTKTSTRTLIASVEFVEYCYIVKQEVVESKNATEIPEKTNVTEETIENIVLPEKVSCALLVFCLK